MTDQPKPSEDTSRGTTALCTMMGVIAGLALMGVIWAVDSDHPRTYTMTTVATAQTKGHISAPSGLDVSLISEKDEGNTLTISATNSSPTNDSTVNLTCDAFNAAGVRVGEGSFGFTDVRPGDQVQPDLSMGVRNPDHWVCTAKVTK